MLQYTVWTRLEENAAKSKEYSEYGIDFNLAYFPQHKGMSIGAWEATYNEFCASGDTAEEAMSNLLRRVEMKDAKCTSKKTVDSFFIKQKVQCELKNGHIGLHERTTLNAHSKWWKGDKEND